MNLNFPTTQFSDTNARTIERLLDKTNKKVVVEIGCWIGCSTYVIMGKVKPADGRVYVIDTFDGSGSYLKEVVEEGFNAKQCFCNNMNEAGFMGNITLMHGTSDDYAGAFSDNSIDLVFIDGDHRYHSVSKDIRNFWAKIKPGGIMAGHDYDSPEWDERFIEEDYHGKHHGVSKAVDEFFPKIEVEDRLWWVTK